MTGYKEFTGLSPQSGAILDHINSVSNLQKSLFGGSPGHSSPGLSVETSIFSTKSSIDLTVVAPAQTLTANEPQVSCTLLLSYPSF